ncbi:MAG: glycoside hydrolase family 31 protein [Anaerolineae bacterium]|nr:glycoside hydrolase family 31 protein [Anaerolineae bacterium]MDW8100468.1 glycoside hydrolase family 31 protein [Anaerolineae bacterium]
MMGFRQEGNSLVWEQDHETVRIEPWGPNGLRVRATMMPEIRDDLPGALLDPTATKARIEVSERRAAIYNGVIAAEIVVPDEGQAGGNVQATIRFLHNTTGAELLAEAPSYFPRPPARQFKPVGGDLFHVQARFKAYDGERLYGLGQHQHGRLDQKGIVVDLYQYNTEVCIPFVLSSRGYGFLWNNPAVGRVELGRNQTRWVAEATPQMDYWITAGDTPAEIMARYADATGHVPLLPKWAAGFWQSKLRYRTQEELLSIAREYKRRGLPLSVIVIDFFHWTKQGDWQFDPKCWPDPAEMVRELEEMGVKLMVSIWPTVNPASANFEKMRRCGLLLRTERGVPAMMLFTDTGFESPVYVHNYDPTHPEARRFIWERAREGYYRHGIKLWWLDACEPEIRHGDHGHLRFHIGNGLAVANIYPLMHQRAFYEGMRAEGEEEIITLCRSAWAGSQRYAAAVWSGDIRSTFEALQAQVPAGMNIGLSGIPWWTTDIGGFLDGDPESPYFRELIVRWFQYGAFCPLFRLHGFRKPTSGWHTGGPNEVWSFGSEAYAIIKELLFLRERLRPYIMEQMRLAHEQGIPPMRPLFFDFPEDKDSWAIEDQFMFGPDLLVAPVLHEGARRREIYLPNGATWADAWTGEAFDGGRWIRAEAPLERIPLFLRENAKLPIRV